MGVFQRLLKADSAVALDSHGTASPLVVIEVGAQMPAQCILAATLGYTTHCFEPSPNSYERLRKSKEEAGKTSAEVEGRLVTHPEAASGMSGKNIPFRSRGGPGDHVGEYDLWRMERKMSKSESANPKAGEIIQVKTAKLDNIVNAQNAGGRQWKVHLLKMEINGHEANALKGLKKSLKAGAVKYIIFQFWPRALDLMNGTEGTCTAGTDVINNIVTDTGYSLHALQVISHIRAPISERAKLWDEEETRPTGSLTAATSQAYCQWFLDLERRHPSPSGEEEYKFGYWSHFIAVAPGAKLPAEVFDGAHRPK